MGHTAHGQRRLTPFSKHKHPGEHLARKKALSMQGRSVLDPIPGQASCFALAEPPHGPSWVLCGPGAAVSAGRQRKLAAVPGLLHRRRWASCVRSSLLREEAFSGEREVGLAEGRGILLPWRRRSRKSRAGACSCRK